MGLQEMMAGFSDARMGGGGVYLKEGNFLLKIIEVKNGHADQGGWDFFLAEFEVMASDNPSIRVGQRVEWMVAFKESRYLSTYQADVKQFLFHAFKGFDPSVTPDSMTEQVWAFATSGQQPLAGKYVAVSVVDKEKKNKPGEFFSKHNFHVWSGPPAEDAAPQGAA